MIELYDWVVTIRSGWEYAPPELQEICLSGRVLNDPRRLDHVIVTTSPIKNINGRMITTGSGTMYKLLEPSENYMRWCKDNNVHVPTVEEPIKDLRGSNGDR